MAEKREEWKTHTGMILAMIGTEVGLGNIWRFPYLVGKFGGGTFLIPYITLLILVALFVMMCEWALGRSTKSGPLGAFRKIKFPFGREVGAWGIIGPFFLECYYVVITSWVLFYIGASFFGLYYGEDSMRFLVNFLASPWVFVGHFIVCLIISWILALGVQKGIERACKFMIPTLFFLLIIITIRSLTLPGAAQGVEFFMRPRWEFLFNPAAWIAALGQVFFTLSLGMSAMIIYGSYMKTKWGIPQNAIACALGNTSSSILAGFAIFPAAFALGMGAAVSGAQSIGLTFVVLPQLFQKMPAGWFFGGLFFLLLTFGALSSAISIQEPAVAWLKEEFGLSRTKGALATGFLLWVLGLPFILNGFVVGGLGTKLALLGKMDMIIGQVALPAFALMAVLAVGWTMKNKGFSEINMNAKMRLSRLAWNWIRYVIPAATLLLLLFTIIQVLEEIKLIPAILPQVGITDFIPLGIGFSTIAMIVLVCSIIWGGFAYFTYKVIRVEKHKEEPAHTL
jgi:NSS family neurotransmitter:Na+ symporter